MKLIFIFILTISSYLQAADVESAKEKKIRIEKQIQIEMEKEKKYSREQTFYSGKNYNLKGAEINPESLIGLPDIEVEDFDMDSVYD